MECACPPERRSITVGAGEIETVGEFFENYPLTHIVCDACNTYYELIGYIDESGVERSVHAVRQPEQVHARRARRVLSFRSRS